MNEMSGTYNNGQNQLNNSCPFVIAKDTSILADKKNYTIVVRS